ncbi:unnamed protein product [Meganyctiphanes norvegica]|uniref:Myosin heavy chain n=1 Tax=Meganyctiphanes norvegica TaxID=48144 RepID=A0AAV2PRK8_MEGNR
MPGHLKKSEGPDPDPTEFLFVSREDKMKDMAKPYDAKKDCWVADPDPEIGFKLGEITKEEGDMIEVMIDCMPKKFKADQVKPVNPPKFEKAVDVSDLTYLNDASVLYNLKARYQAKLMYTYSGLFCIAVNPYKRYPIYTGRAAKIYMGKRRNEVPPHVFAISENAYANMRQNSQNQSMLITGESGAGKTENTKKVITYFGYVGASGAKLKPGEKAKASLEDQIVATNPVLEAFGNAKTTRNDNSSRFGKFIRIHFQPNGKLAGADIENYLLEKSRVVDQAKQERGYHIFYNVMSDHVDYLKKMCKLTDDIYDYPWQSKGKVTVASIDDKEDMEYAHNAFSMLLFPDDIRDYIYQITASTMHCGNMKFKQKGRDDQAEPDGDEAARIIAELSGVDPDQMLTNYCKPKIKVGAELLVKGQTVEKATDSVGAMAKGMFDRLFSYLVITCNKTLFTGMKRHSFIGVLDIAGFEIFDYNGFEQICINFCNEKLQQFFNHHMFVLEQEEYKKEEIQWVFIDFGMDLAACIELFEKPMGLLSILEEESMFPKATDKSFAEKLTANCLGKSVAFIKPKGDAHFGCCHYAGVVNYNITGWLEKNKDPLNDTVCDQLKKGTNVLLVELFANHPGQSAPAEDKSAKGGKGGKKKSGGFKTVSSGYREQLNNLLVTLNATDPHFIRCIVPNECKCPGMVTAALVMHQLTCNGVLEGIRICQLGLPNRMIYADFKQRYAILGAQFFATMGDHEAVKATFDDVGLDAEKYRVGSTKVFFRAGVLGEVEEIRDNVIGAMVCLVQNWVRGFMGRRKFKLLQEQRVALTVVQRNIRKYIGMKSWIWFYLWVRVKPLISMPSIANAIKELKVRSEASVGACKIAEEKAIFLEAQHGQLLGDIVSLKDEVEATAGNAASFIENFALISAQKDELEKELTNTAKLYEAEQEAKNEIINQKKVVEMDVLAVKGDLDVLAGDLAKLNSEKDNRDHQIRVYNDEIAHTEELLGKATKEKKLLQEINAKNSEEFGGVDERASHLNKIKQKLESTHDELNSALNNEKKKRANLEKEKRKVEGDVKLTMETVGDLERNKKELESLVFKKDAEWSMFASKYEDEQMNSGKVGKYIKELQSKVEELEDEVKHENNARAKAESGKKKLERDYGDITDRLDEAGGATLAQVELYKKREAEYAKIKRDIEESNIQHDAAVAAFRKKHNDSVAEMSEQLDHLSKLKQKLDKEKDVMRHEAEEAKAAMDALAHDKAAAEKTGKTVHAHILEIQTKLDEVNRCVSDFDCIKKKLSVENGDLLRQLEEAGAQYSQLYKITQNLGAQLEGIKKVAYDENKERVCLLGKYRNLEHDLDGLREQLNEESDAKWELQRSLQRANADANMYRAKYESEGIARAEELEAARLKISARLEEAEQQIEQLNFKNTSLEKIKARIGTEFDVMSADCSRAQALAAAAEKKQRNFEKVISEWKMKVDDLARDVDASQLEARNYSAELFKAKAQYDESLEHLDVERRANKQLSEEIKDLMDQICEGGRNLHDMSKNVKKYEIEKEELQAALEEAETALENEENKVLKSQLELSQVKQEIDRRVHQKEEEFDATRKVHIKAVENMQAALEAEAKARAEALRQKAKYEADIHELEISLDHANKANSDLAKTIKKVGLDIKTMQDKYMEENNLASEFREQFSVAERRGNSLHGELEESRTLLEQSDRGRRQAEADLADVNEQYQDLYNQHNSLSIVKRKIESEYQTLSADLNEMLNDAKASEDKAKKAMVDAARLADELRAEQEQSHNLGTQKKSLEAQYKDLHLKLDEAETSQLKSGKRAYSKLEARIHELEVQFDDEARKHSDAQKSLRKAERKIKELTFQSEEDKKNHERMQDLVDKLQLKVKTYKRQIEEAEEIAALNLAKYRKAEGELSA